MIDPDDLTRRNAYRSMPLAKHPGSGRATLVEVVVLWGPSGPLAVAHLREGERFVLAAQAASSAETRRFVHPSIDRGEHTLVERRGDACVVTLPASATASMTGDHLACSSSTFELPRDAVARVEYDGLAFSLRHVPRPERLPAARRDRLFGIATVLALTCIATVVAWTRRDDNERYLSRVVESESAWVAKHGMRLHGRAYPMTHPTPDVDDEGGTGQRASDDEGSAGLHVAARASRRWRAPPQRATVRVDDVTRDAMDTTAIEQVARRGIFAALGATGAGAWRLPPSSDAENRDATGAMYGATIGDAHGYEGLGLLGTGWGGGGVGQRIVGLGGIRTRGHGSDDGTAQGSGGGGACGCGEGARNLYGSRSGGLAVRASSGPIVCGLRTVPGGNGSRSEGGCIVGEPMSSMAPEEIRRVVLRNIGQVRYCYEQALERNPGAHGRVTVRWVIGSAGVVLASAITSNETGSAPLAECVAGAVRRWQFPAPANGGVVTVNYPFDLSAAEP